MAKDRLAVAVIVGSTREGRVGDTVADWFLERAGDRDEWHAKPVCFVSYGYSSQGRYAVQQLRCVFTELHPMSLRDGVGLHLVEELPQGPERAAWARLHSPTASTTRTKKGPERP